MRSAQLGIAGLAAVIAASVSANAAVIVAYTGEAATPSTTASGAAATALAVGDANALVDVNFVGGYASDTVYRFVPTNAGTTVTTPADSIANNRYYGFTATANAGNELDLTSFSFIVGRGGGTTPRGYDVRSSVDGYAATLGQSDVGVQRPNFVTVPVDLSGSQYQHLSSIQLRIYGYTPGSGQSIDLDTITLNGTVAAVPEPAAVAFGLGLAGLALTRRNRRA